MYGVSLVSLYLTKSDHFPLVYCKPIVYDWGLQYLSRPPQQSQSSWRYEMETFSALLALCAVNSPHKGQWPGALMFSLIWAWTNNRSQWFEMPSRSLWYHCNDRNPIASPWGWDIGCLSLEFKVKNLFFTVVICIILVHETVLWDLTASNFL